MHSHTRFLAALVVAAAFSLTTDDSSAADKKAPKGNSLQGKITAVDKEAKTVTVAGRTVAVDDTTIITDSGKPTKLENLKPGTDATVSTFMLGEKLTAVNIRTGAVAATAPAAKKKK